jgi:phage gp36-like protein
MSFITVAELNTHLYGELVNEITRGNDQIAQMAIDAATAEVKSYLSDYDVQAIFTATGDNRNPLMLLLIKDIAAWHLVCLANPNIDIELRKTRYENAIKWLKGVQRGEIVPDLPRPTPPVDSLGNPIVMEGKFHWGGNTKRENHY